MGYSEDLLNRLIERGMALGADYVEARYQEDRGFTIALLNGRLTSVQLYRARGIGVRVLVNGSLGFAASNSLEVEDLFKTVDSAFTRAKVASKLRKSPIEFSEERLGRSKYRVVEKKPLVDFKVEDAVRFLTEVYKAVAGEIKDAKLASLVEVLRVHLQDKVVMTSDGGHIESYIPRLYVLASSTLLYQNRSLQRRREFGATGGVELLDEWKVASTVLDELKRLEKVLTKGVSPPSDKVDIVLGPEVVGLIVHESAGHPMEADRILGREAAQAGESYVKPEMIGAFRVGDQHATVIEDPTIPGSYGYYLYDDECVRARPRYLYREGLVYEPLHNRHTAKIFGVKSNGAARAMDYASEPIIRMSNTYLEPGNMNFEELIEDIELGVYVKSYMEWNIDDARWNQRYVGLEAYLIRNGELAEPVLNPVLEFTTGWFYSNIVGKDKNLEFYPGTCGKGEPSQGVPVWFGGPNVRISKLKVGVLR